MLVFWNLTEFGIKWLQLLRKPLFLRKSVPFFYFFGILLFAQIPWYSTSVRRNQDAMKNCCRFHNISERNN